jgi:hypothetical protein
LGMQRRWRAEHCERAGGDKKPGSDESGRCGHRLREASFKGRVAKRLLAAPAPGTFAKLVWPASLPRSLTVI